MGRKCFISCKTEDFTYKSKIQNELDIEWVDKSLNDSVNSNDEDYIMRVIRDKYLSDSTVTIHLIGPYSAENRGWNEQRFIKRELQASLYDGEGNTKNGILGVVLPSVHGTIYSGPYGCNQCGDIHRGVQINNNTTVSEFNQNYYIPAIGKCSWNEDDRYCVLVPWDDFAIDPDRYIEDAFAKRTHPISDKTRVRP